MVDLKDRSPMGLVDALCKRLEKVMKSFWQESEFPKDEAYHVPFVHAQYLPVSLTASKDRDMTKDYPLVIVKWVEEGIDDFSEAANGDHIKIHIQFGGYSKDTNNQGWRIPAAMQRRALTDLLADTICNGFQLVAPIKSYPTGKEEPPYYGAITETTWDGAPPAVEVPSETNFDGKEIEQEFKVAGT
jgi:hypothetical protein